MVTATAPKSSMNEASERDPFNNNSYGTLVDSPYKAVNLPVLDVTDFNERIIRGYEEGYGEKELPADLSLARSLVPAGTARLNPYRRTADGEELCRIRERSPCCGEHPIVEHQLDREAGVSGRIRTLPRRSSPEPFLAS